MLDCETKGTTGPNGKVEGQCRGNWRAEGFIQMKGSFLYLIRGGAQPNYSTRFTPSLEIGNRWAECERRKEWERIESTVKISMPGKRRESTVKINIPRNRRESRVKINIPRKRRESIVKINIP